MVVDDEKALTGEENVFRGITVDPAVLPEDPARFKRQLASSLATWRSAGLKVAWLEIPTAKAALVPIAVAAGFDYHHSQPGYVMLTYVLQPEAFVPIYATHFIGAGGLVLNDRRELLVVWERAHRHRRPYYKLPGGALKPGEHLVAGVKREVWEETGIETRFLVLTGFRHWHGYRFGKSDIYFICRLEPLTEEIRIQASEIQEALWMPVDDYLADENVGVFNKRMVEAALNGPGLVPSWFDAYDVDPATREIFIPEGEM